MPEPTHPDQSRTDRCPHCGLPIAPGDTGWRLDQHVVIHGGEHDGRTGRTGSTGGASGLIAVTLDPVDPDTVRRGDARRTVIVAMRSLRRIAA
jgi:hypothetical protein